MGWHCCKPIELTSQGFQSYEDYADSGRVGDNSGEDPDFGDGRDDDSAGDNSEEDPNFVDSDYELDADDDDLF